ncbi:hypothetical protein HZY93_03750 [Streptococcus danieliae]|uniref:Uncharacterized protein n=1 Tax=Streptococcus danieliae TaxID=747656 RepID=A0A7Z0RQM0_9STRE|nr:hypothetical protein [Streptococcus danieliae]MBF0717155.1 hypothetical protein [Streptococcus danieliae]NYS49085.1 hypothetical protein [Streptococcus danieliae]
MRKICSQGLRAMQLLLALYGSFLLFPVFLLSFNQVRTWLGLGQGGTFPLFLPLLSYGFLAVFLGQSLMRPWLGRVCLAWFWFSLLGLVGLQSAVLGVYLVYYDRLNLGTVLALLLLASALSAQLLRERLGMRLDGERYSRQLLGIFSLVMLFSLLMSLLGFVSSLPLGLVLLFLLDALLLWGQLEGASGPVVVPARQTWLGFCFFGAILLPLVVIYWSPLGQEFAPGLRLAPVYDRALLVALVVYLVFSGQWLGFKEAYLSPAWQELVEGLNGSASGQSLEVSESLCQKRMDAYLCLWLLEFFLLLAGLCLYLTAHPLNWVSYYLTLLLPAYSLLQLLQVFQSLFQDLLQFSLVWRLVACFCSINGLFAGLSIWLGIFYFGFGFLLGATLAVALAYRQYEGLRGQWLYAIVSYYE